MRIAAFGLLLLGLWPGVLHAGEFEPDPASVRREGTGYRYPQAGWIVLHIEGEPYERGLQHGRLLAGEIAAYLRCCAAIQSPKSPAEGWKLTRTIVNSLFLRRFDREYLEEMKGIAAGAAAAGAKIEGRAVDLIDIVALNSMEEIQTLESALDALPTGLEGVRFPTESAKIGPAPKPSRCSAFIAAGPATKDGKIVMGHITMSDLYSGNYCNIWLDIKPAKGHRLVMQTFPGGIQSGLDYYINDAGMLICETTIGQTGFDKHGMALASRIRKAVQYAESIDRVVEILKEENNGLYSNEWLLGDTKTNEIAMFELGTRKSRLWRGSKNEWFGGTEGFYWGCNNAKDLEVRLETIASAEGRPVAAVFRPSNRDQAWLKMYDAHKGTMDARFGGTAFGTAPIAAYHSIDAKITTTELSRELKSWAMFGPPLGRTWKPTVDELDKYPEIRPLVSNPATLLHVRTPHEKKTDVAAVDLRGILKPVIEPDHVGASDDDDDDVAPSTPAAWHGTILPKSDGDLWLALAFAKYEHIVAQENALVKKNGDGKLSDSDRRTIDLALFAHLADYDVGVRAGGDVALSKMRSELRRDSWYRIATGKGVLLLHALREKIGGDKFDSMMNSFGKENAGKTVTTAAFRAVAEKTMGKALGEFFDEWLDREGLPAKAKLGAGPFAVTSFHSELERTLIVYGTLDELPTNKEAAEALQQAIRVHYSNVTVALRADRDLSAEELKSNHLLLIGRPDCNSIVGRVSRNLPVTFGQSSFKVGDDTYAHAGSAVIAAAANPDNPRYSVVVMAGLGAYSTWRVAPQLPRMHAAEIFVLPNGGSAKPMLGKAEEKKKGP